MTEKKKKKKVRGRERLRERGSKTETETQRDTQRELSFGIRIIGEKKKEKRWGEEGFQFQTSRE